MRYTHAQAERLLGAFSRAGTSILAARRVAWMLIGLGVLLRVGRYADNRSLWLDESFLALNITNRSPAELLHQLDFNTAAPAGFLLLEKLSVQTLGDSEYALRLFPLLFGILSLILFDQLARRLVSPWAAVVGLAFFALLEPLVYYSSEAKQYGVDVAVVLVVLLAATQARASRPTPRRVLVFGLLGAGLIWLSHPATVALTGVGITLLAATVFRREWRRAAALAAAYSLWAASFVAFFLISVADAADLRHSYRLYEKEAFAPLPPVSVGDAKWFATNALGFAHSLGMTALWGLVAALVTIAGAVSLARRSREKFLLLAAPLLVTVVASGFERYPLFPRFELFLIPILLLLLAEGLSALRRRSLAPIAVVLLGAILIFHPTQVTAGSAIEPQDREEVKPLVLYLEDRWERGDALYVYFAAQYALRYYLDCADCATRGAAAWRDSLGPAAGTRNFAPALESRAPHVVVGCSRSSGQQGYLSDLRRLKGKKRAWFLFAHTLNPNTKVDDEEFFLAELERMGTQRDAQVAKSASLYLYDLRDARNPELDPPQ